MPCTNLSIYPLPDVSPACWTIREEQADYTAQNDDEHDPSAPKRRGRLLGEDLRITREIMAGLAADRTRRERKSTARDNDPTEAENDDPFDVPDDPALLSARLHLLARAADCDLAEQLVLLLAFDRSRGWHARGCSSCVNWMNLYLGIASSTGYERLQVARELESLPIIAALFRVGQLSWSKVRLLCRIADADNEEALALAALEMSVTACQRMCNDYRHARSPSEGEDNEAAWHAFKQRSLTWRETDAHSIEIRMRLPKDRAAEFIATLELHEDALHEDGDAEITARQRRADAALVMAAQSLCAVGEAVVTADRYRVHVSATLETVVGETTPAESPARPTVRGFGSIAPATAQRICCDAGLSIVATGEAGELVDVGRRQRAWPARLRRAILCEQGCCQVPGCGATKWLDVHHIVPWQHGGKTSAANAAVVCRRCHVMLHEGGFTLARNTHEDIDQHLPHAAIQHRLRVERFRLIGPTTGSDACAADSTRVESASGSSADGPGP